MAPTYVPYVISDIINEADNVRTFRLAPAEGGKPPLFKAGQFFMLRLPNAPAELKPPFRSYSCLCPPGGATLEFGIKLHGAFTTELFKRVKGDKIEVSGPYGLFTLPDPITTPLVFLAGGIGITPLACFAQQLVKQQHGKPFFLFYSNRHETEIAYKGLLESLSDLNENFHPIFTLTCDEAPLGWTGSCGRINLSLIQKYLSAQTPLSSCHFYLCGSPPFVSGLIELLKSSGVPDAQIHKEQW